jgi:beta-galactosidase/beta-glucuronidase
MPAESPQIPRPEYPRPHRVRERWLNLNGTWQFAFDDDDRGLHDGWHTSRPLPRRIVVPFCPEAPLSGIEDRSVHPVVWYRREVDIPPDFLRHRLLLHVGACDFATQIWVNGRAVGSHRGGYTPIACEIQNAARAGTNEIVIRAEDHPVWSQPRGKQIVGEKPELIDYDRVTGIWQTVWVEPVPEIYVEDVWSHYRLTENRLVLRWQTNREFAGDVEVIISRGASGVVHRDVAIVHARREGRLELIIPRPLLWSIGTPTLYDIEVSLRVGGSIVDSVKTYAGLREFSCKGRAVYLNGEPFYFRGVLDQGYFPGGWYTAPTDADLKRDIELMQALGFNGARKHQKAEDPRWLAWADRLGFVVWAEMGSGRQFCTPLVEDFTREWAEVVRRDRMHPSIMAWVPLNESWGVEQVQHSMRQQEWVRTLYHLTNALDGTRPVVANDGWQYCVGDIWGVHNYIPEAAFLGQTLQELLADPNRELVPGRSAALPGADVAHIPVMLTEFGGVAFNDPGRSGVAGAWGYDRVQDPGEFARRLRALVQVVSEQPQFSGFVWTQLTDVQQETNGLLYFDRTPKLPVETYRGIFGKE